MDFYYKIEVDFFFRENERKSYLSNWQVFFYVVACLKSNSNLATSLRDSAEAFTKSAIRAHVYVWMWWRDRTEMNVPFVFFKIYYTQSSYIHILTNICRDKFLMCVKFWSSWWTGCKNSKSSSIVTLFYHTKKCHLNFTFTWGAFFKKSIICIEIRFCMPINFCSNFFMRLNWISFKFYPPGSKSEALQLD